MWERRLRLRAFEVLRFDFSYAPVVYVALCDKPLIDEVAQPITDKSIVVIVVDTHGDLNFLNSNSSLKRSSSSASSRAMRDV